MSVRTIKLIIIWLMGVLMGAVTWFAFELPTMAVITGGVFIGGMGKFIQLDLKNVIKGTKAKKIDDFDQMNIARYVNSAIIFSVLLAEVFIYEKLHPDMSNDALKIMFSASAMAILVTIVNGLQANALAAKTTITVNNVTIDAVTGNGELNG